MYIYILYKFIGVNGAKYHEIDCILAIV